MKIVSQDPIVQTITIAGIQLLAAHYNFADQSITFDMQPMSVDGYGIGQRQSVKLNPAQIQMFFGLQATAGETAFSVLKRAFVLTVADQFGMTGATVSDAVVPVVVASV